MLYLISPDQTWLFLYSSLFFVFLFQIFFFGAKIQDFVILFSLLTLAATEYNIIHKTHTILQTVLLFASLSLISYKYSKKLIFYFFSITVYFTGITLAHSFHIESTILPAVSFFLIFAIYQTHILIPNNNIQHVNTKENTRFILLTIVIFQQLIEVENHFFAWIYAIFAIYIIVRAFCIENKENQIFYGFFSFFLITVSYTLFSKIAIYYATYLFLYTTVAFFLYETARKFESRIFLLPITFAALHILHTVVNPSFFLIKHIQTIGLSASIFYNFSEFIYFSVFATIIKSLYLFYKKAPKNQIPWIPFIYIICTFTILIEAQILHNILTPSIDILYSTVLLSIILHILYLTVTYCILLLIQYTFYFVKKNYTLPIISMRVPQFSNIKFLFNLHLGMKNIFPIFKTNLIIVHSYNFLLIPIFLVFYLIISFYY